MTSEHELNEPNRVTPSSNAASSVVGWQLTAVSEALGELSLEITDTLTVGRGTDNNMVLGSKAVSRHHAEFNVLNGQLYVKDLASSNGTFVNDTPLEANKSKCVAHRDMVSFAGFGFVVTQLTAAADDKRDQHVQTQTAASEPTTAAAHSGLSDLPAQPIQPSLGISDPAVAESSLESSNIKSQPAPVAQTTVQDLPVTSASQPVLVDSQSQSASPQSQPTIPEPTTTNMKTAAPQQPLQTAPTDTNIKISDSSEAADRQSSSPEHHLPPAQPTTSSSRWLLWLILIIALLVIALVLFNIS